MAESHEADDDLVGEAELAALLDAPAETVIGNHVFHLLELAALHLSADPPQLAPARLTIDAVQGLLDAVGDRLGEHGPLLAEALSQIQFAFVSVSSAATRTTS